MSTIGQWQVLARDSLSNETYPLQQVDSETDALIAALVAIEASRQWDEHFADGEEDDSNHPDAIVLVRPDGRVVVFPAN